MPSLSNLRTGNAGQIYGNEWDSNPERKINKTNFSSGIRTMDVWPQQSDALPLRYASTKEGGGGGEARDLCVPLPPWGQFCIDILKKGRIISQSTLPSGGENLHPHPP